MNATKVNAFGGDGVFVEKRWYETLYQLLPNLRSEADESKGFTMYREFKPTRDQFEYTLYYHIPAKNLISGEQVKKRVDFNVDAELIELGVEHVTPSDVRIEYWGNAKRFQ